MIAKLNSSFVLNYSLGERGFSCSDDVGKSFKRVYAIGLKKLYLGIASVKVDDIISIDFACNTSRLAGDLGDSIKCKKSLQITNLYCVQMFLKSMSYILALQLLSSRPVNNSLEVI